MNKSSLPPIPRLEGEPTAWFSRAVSFILAGPGRSAVSVYASEKAAKPKKDQKGPPKCLPGAWKDAMTRWNWRERAEMYDAALVELEQKENTRLRERERKKRLFLLIEARKKLQTIISTLNPAAASWNAVAALLRAIGSESREEFELADLDRRLAELEANPDDSQACYTDRFRHEMKRLAGVRDDADAA